jgi:hypothetical protein
MNDRKRLQEKVEALNEVVDLMKVLQKGGLDRNSSVLTHDQLVASYRLRVAASTGRARFQYMLRCAMIRKPEWEQIVEAEVEFALQRFLEAMEDQCLLTSRWSD